LHARRMAGISIQEYSARSSFLIDKKEAEKQRTSAS